MNHESIIYCKGLDNFVLLVAELRFNGILFKAHKEGGEWVITLQ